MTTDTPHHVIEQIHSAGRQLVLMLTGGGSRAIGELLSVPGGSNSVLEAVVPYSARALHEHLGGSFDHACSEPTARRMAAASFQRGRTLGSGEASRLVGIGATASLATNRPKRGPHRIHVAWQTATETASWSCQLEKGQRTRQEEEQLAARCLLWAVAESCGVACPEAAMRPQEQPVRRHCHAAPAWQDLMLGKIQKVRVNQPAEPPAVVFPGAFHPLHEGHCRMAELTAARLAAPITFELSIANVDKPPLDYLEIDERLDQFNGRPVLLTRADTFQKKAELAPGCTFVVGVDTIERIGQLRYYGDSPALRDAAVARLAELGCRFLVFGRVDDGCFRTLEDIAIPDNLRRLCDTVSEGEFRADVSSTRLRQRQADSG